MDFTVVSEFSGYVASLSSVCVYKCVCCVFVNIYKLFVFWRVSCVDFI